MGNDIGVIILLVLLIVSAFLLGARKLAKTSGGKRMQKEKHSDGLVHILAPSVLGACICAVCLCGMSWAWFTASTAASATPIRSAKLDIENVTIKESKAAEPTSLTFDANGKYYTAEVSEDGTYTLSFNATEDSTASKGFCRISVKIGDSAAETAYYTEDIANKTAYEVTIIANKISNKNVTIKVESIWGSIPENATTTNTIEIKGTDDEALNNADAGTPETAAAASPAPAETTQPEPASAAAGGQSAAVPGVENTENT